MCELSRHSHLCPTQRIENGAQKKNYTYVFFSWYRFIIYTAHAIYNFKTNMRTLDMHA